VFYLSGPDSGQGTVVFWLYPDRHTVISFYESQTGTQSPVWMNRSS